jgi:uncharacterized protein
VQNFLPWQGLIGGILIGLAAGLYLLVNGRTAGISGIIEDALKPDRQGFGVAAAFLAGLPLGGLLIGLFAPQLAPMVKITGSTGLIIAAGLLVGFGARLGSGCTSGHGVCGLPRFSMRSMVATATFMATAAMTVFIVRHVI